MTSKGFIIIDYQPRRRKSRVLRTEHTIRGRRPRVVCEVRKTRDFRRRGCYTTPTPVNRKWTLCYLHMHLWFAPVVFVHISTCIEYFLSFFWVTREVTEVFEWWGPRDRTWRSEQADQRAGPVHKRGRSYTVEMSDGSTRWRNRRFFRKYCGPTPFWTLYTTTLSLLQVNSFPSQELPEGACYTTLTPVNRKWTLCYLHMHL